MPPSHVLTARTEESKLLPMQLQRTLTENSKVKKVKTYPSVFLENLNMQYVVLDKDTILIQRKLNLEDERVIRDIFGRGWVFMSGEVKKNQVSLKLANGKLVEIPEGCFSAYFPAFSFVEWHLAKGEIEVEMLTRISSPSIEAPSHPIFYPQYQQGSIFQHLNSFLKKGPPKTAQNVDRACYNCHLSQRTLNYIKAHYDKSFSLKDLSEKFKTSPSVLSRYFKRCCGMSPIEFLNTMRVLNSLGDLLLDRKRILDIALDVGFSDVRMYNEHFSKIVGIKPSSFFKREPLGLA